ncbi:hypothetical protein [Pontibacillus marinus]|uniref:Uncharacterized protein n=1 Tax=Pontibacillus marinus BH030004 = DSM 16465 TaxID=1385511 RepID=A0A0A5I4T0_9BACI|nr:hypothetical protein [Pontibacillus marinus]KGX90837.1 hypothetical protein N783_18470 [Pontibacillus marinus BH030004 = DSM 16465]
MTKVHEIKEEVIVPANHRQDETVHYHVCYGTVNWEKTEGAERKAIYVLMSYHGVKNYRVPAHLTLDSEGEKDFDKVMEAMRYLREKYKVLDKYEVHQLEKAVH